MGKGSFHLAFFIIMRPCIVGILIPFLTSLTIAQSISDVKLLQKDGNSITLEFTPNVVQHAQNGIDKKSYAWFSFLHSSVEIDSNSGELRFIRRVPLLLPSQQYTVTIVKADSRIESINNFPKAQALHLKRIFRSGFPNSRLVDLRDIVRRGNSFIATLVYRPVEKLNEKSVKIYSNIIVRLTFGASIPASMQCLALLNCNNAAAVLHSAQLKNTNVKSKNAIRKNAVTGQSAASYTSPISQGTWYRLGVTETGMYKLDYNFFKNNGIASSFWTSIRNIHLYGNGGAPAPESLSASYPQDLQEIKRLVVDKNNNGVFDNGDYIVFYGKAASGWTYNNSSKTFNHYINPYADTNYYFITSMTNIEGDSMSVISSAVSDTASAAFSASFQGKVFVEEDKQNLIASGREWVGQQFSSNSTSASYTNTLPGFITGLPILYRFVFYARSSTTDYLNITENSSTLVSSVPLGAMTQDALGDNSVDYALETDVSKTLSGAIPNGSSVLTISYSTSNQSALAWLDWIEILYSSSYTATNDFLLCTSPDTTALIKYSVSHVSAGDDFVFDVTDHANVQRVNNFSFTNGVCEFFLPQTAGNIRELAITGSNGLKSVQSITSVNTTDNLHDQSKACDLIIITPADFLTAANQLKTYRETSDTIKTNVVDVQDVFKEFSGGMQDPTGIRNFLYYAYTYWNAKYVLLLGEGHYDYRNIATTARNWIIPYETEESINQSYSYVSDDYFVRLIDGDSRPTMAIGRIPARNAADAAQAVNKIITYETSSPQDVWRNCITFVGDDQYATRIIGDTATMLAGDPTLWQPYHCEYTETLDSSYTPNSFEKRKILLPEYPDVASASGRHKPEAIAAIINAVNTGTLVVNYIGHSNDQVWSHTEVFTVDGSIPSLTNANKLSCFIVAACSWGLFDNPSSISGGELLMTMAQGGAVLEVSASRIVDEFGNIELDDYLFANMFLKDSNGNPPRFGDAMLAVKQVYTDVNSQIYNLFGDPTVRLAMPRMTARIDSMNGRNANSPLKVQALGLVQAQGSIAMQNTQRDTTFTGTGYFTIFDAYRYLKFNGFPASDSFKVLGSALYNGTISISNGAYIAKGPIPKDVTYGQNTRISLYAFENKKDAEGYNEMLTISGIDTAAAADVTGPSINIYLNDLAFQSGDIVTPSTSLIVKLSDSSGINTSTSGVGHQMTAYLTNPEETIVLSDYYRGDPNTYKTGTVTYPLSGLTEGSHTLQVKAWDIYNNGSQEQISFMVKSGNETAMSNIFNYPNPFSSSTIFTFQRNSIDPIDVEIKIYTIAGRCIRVIHSAALTNRFVQVFWDGTDAEGAKIANGIYLYKIVARSLSSNNSNEYIGKIARVH